MYKLIISKIALKELDSLSKNINTPIVEAIDNLAVNPRPTGSKKLKGEKEYLWRIRVGNYRVIYLIEDEIKIVEIRKIGHRKDIYD